MSDSSCTPPTCGWMEELSTFCKRGDCAIINDGLCCDPDPQKVILVSLLGLAGCAIIGVAVFLYCYRRSRRHNAVAIQQGGAVPQTQYQQYTPVPGQVEGDEEAYPLQQPSYPQQQPSCPEQPSPYPQQPAQYHQQIPNPQPHQHVLPAQQTLY